MKHIGITIILVLVASFSAQRQCVADWINLTGAENARNIAEIHIENDLVRLKLEIFVEDLIQFEDLLPDDFFEDLSVSRPSSEERVKRFSEQGLQFITGTGENLLAEIVSVEPRLRVERQSLFAGKINPFTGQIIPGPPTDKRVLYAELAYRFDTKPDSLTIVAPSGDNGLPRVALGFILYHLEVPVVDFRFLSEPSALTLNWDDPWYSGFEKKSLKRWQQSGIKTFLYIDPYEVRHETLVRIKDLNNWLDLDLSGDDYILPEEWEPLKEKIGQFFLDQSNVRIDGAEQRKFLDRISFIKYTMTRTYFLEQPEKLPLNTAMIGVIITYPTDGIPSEVTVDWDLFSEKVSEVPASSVDPAGPFPYTLSPDDNVLVWKNFLKKYTLPTVTKIVADQKVTHFSVPLLSLLFLVLLGSVIITFIVKRRGGRSSGILVLTGVGLLLLTLVSYPYTVSIARPAAMGVNLTEEEARVILSSLLKNVYRSFDFREENDVYDRLEKVAAGELLTDIYLLNRRSFEVKQAGGAQARVKQVSIEEITAEPDASKGTELRFLTVWTAAGEVGHWGHTHIRENRYNGSISIKPIDGSWKITGLDIIDEQRIDPYAGMSTGTK